MQRFLGTVSLFFFFFYGICIPNVYSRTLPKVAIKKIRVYSLPTGIKIKLNTTGKFFYKSFILSSRKSEKYIVVDIWPAYLPQVRKTISVRHPQVKKIKISQFNRKTVRVAIQLTKKLAYNTKKWKNNLTLFIHSPKPLKRKKKTCILGVKVSYPPPQGLKIIINTQGKPHFKDFILPGFKKLSPRLVIDLWPAYLPKGFMKKANIKHPFVSQLRVAQFNKQTVRIVLSLKISRIPYKISFQENRLILNAFSATASKGSSAILPSILGLKIKKVVIDPGHGGRDPGAIGYKGLKEKDITLKLAYLLKKRLETDLGCKVILTRYRDKFVSLERRAAIANRHKADLFISLHCNACPSHRLHGIETYFVGLTDDQYALAVAARENASLNKGRGELNDVLLDLLAKAKIKESAYLAAEIQKSLIQYLRGKRYNPVRDLGVKQAPFYVLIGTDMPAVLIETGFIDHLREGRRFCRERYLQRLAEGIVRGIENYIKVVKYAPNRERRIGG